MPVSTPAINDWGGLHMTTGVSSKALSTASSLIDVVAIPIPGVIIQRMALGPRLSERVVPRGRLVPRRHEIMVI